MSKVGIATNKKIIELFNMMKSKTLVLQPSFQRNLVWNDQHKENFIDTILNGLPFPEVYFSDGDIDLEIQQSTTLVVDGQQRLNTIYEYITGSEKIKYKNIKRFEDLSPKAQTKLFDYNVVVRDLGRITDDEIKEIFNRINSVQYALNAMEINNALYEGEYIATAKQIIDDGKLSKFDVFNEGEVSRMKDIEFILLIMATLDLEGYFASYKEVEPFIKRYDNEYPNKKAMIHTINNALDTLNKLKLKPDSMWFRKTGFFTLVVEISKLVRAGETLSVKDLKIALSDFENEIYRNKDKNTDTNKFAEFYKYMFQSTTSRKGRQVRGQLLEDYLAES